MMLTEQQLLEKWDPVLNESSLPDITDPYRRAVTAILLENQEQALAEAAPTNVAAGVAGYDPVLISMVRRAMPHLIAYDVCGVQPMTTPTGLVFAMRSRYTGQSGVEALWNEASTTFAGATITAGQTGSFLPGAAILPSTAAAGATITLSVANANLVDIGMPVAGVGITGPVVVSAVAGGVGTATGVITLAAITQNGVTGVLGALSASGNYQFGDSVGTGIATATGEGATPATMGFTIEKITVTAQTYQLSTGYSVELAQDMKALHGLNADTELTNILGSELLAEQNRVVLRNIYNVAKAGAQKGTANAGVIDVGTGNDVDGRYMSEKFRGLLFQIQRDVNAIAYDVRFGKGNILIVSGDVASALAAAGTLTYTPAIQSLESLGSDFTQNTFVGTIGQIKVFVDPYATQDFYVVGFKGSNSYQAGMFFCPYVPAQLLRATDPATFQPLLAMKMRYGITYNPLATGIGGVGGNFRQNGFYRIGAITNLVK
jgi:hypothetical protein